MAIKVQLARPNDGVQVQIFTDTAEEAIAVVRLIRPEIFGPDVDEDDDEPATPRPPHQRCSICRKPDHRAPRCPTREKVAPAKPPRPLAPPPEKRAPRRCGICRERGHEGPNCPKHPLSRPTVAEPKPAPTRGEIDRAAAALRDAFPSTAAPMGPALQDRVCPQHEEPLREITGRLVRGRQVYHCPRGHETENSMRRSAE